MPIGPRYADLFERMCDDDPEAADAAFDAVLFDRGEAVPDLIECYERKGNSGRLRFLVVQLLGFSDSLDAIPTLVDALNDRDVAVRAEACRSLEDLRINDALPHLEARLNDVDAEVRLAAFEALEVIRHGDQG